MATRRIIESVDRGWAWIIVFAITIINLGTLPVQQCFGLIFEKRFSDLRISAMQTSLILHLNGSISCGLGLISGPMMKRFSYRQVAILAGLTITAGILLTAFALSFPTLIITYCLFIGIGQGLMFPATTLALNTYFRKKRKIAMGIAVTLTALGPIFMPILIVKLLEEYSTTGTILILAGIAFHSIIGALLLRPLKENYSKVVMKPLANLEAESVELNNCDSSRQRNDSKQTTNESDKTNNLLFHETTDDSKVKEEAVFRQFIKTMGLHLLRDNRYIAVILGMGISLVAETNFNMMLPFVLTELSGLERGDVAKIMSVQAFFDIAGRICVPLLAQKMLWTARNLYIVSLLGSTFGRTPGLSKGTKAVFQALIIPDYVTLEMLPAASGIMMATSGILSIFIGPLIGFVHDSMDSYVGALHFTSILSMCCVILWLATGLWRFKCNNNDAASNSDVSENERTSVKC
ncbi:monocarboxylate transporter 14-like isoform X2 [Prorops nasuta]|uniref:monocarboxylate transporter 14-like isoform X2 n=1 Tax=Prorops nasuta TaxID=863751 RepID=UPI0034CE184C